MRNAKEGYLSGLKNLNGFINEVQPTCILIKVSGACRHKGCLCEATLLACMWRCHFGKVLLHSRLS